MPFDPKKLPSSLRPQAGVNGAFYERLYRRHKPRWFSLCRHQAAEVDTEDTFPSWPNRDFVIEQWQWNDSGEQLSLVTSKCLVCRKPLLEGRLRKKGGMESSVGTLYVLSKQKFVPAPKDIPDKDLRDFYEHEWEFITTLLADFNKLTIAVAVAASVFFDKYPSVFYAFVITCFVMIALYIAAYIGQRQISKKYYADAGKALVPSYKSGFDTASKYLQAIFCIAIIVVLCLMIRAERMNLRGNNDDLQRTRPYNPPSRQPQNPPPSQQPQPQPAKKD